MYTQRIGWETWVPCNKDDRWYAWQIVSLLLLTNSVHDKIVKTIVEEMFNRFPDPICICRNPTKFLDFLTSQAKNFTPLDKNFDEDIDGISKGPNFCFQKAKYIVSTTKLVVLLWCIRNVPSCIYALEDLQSMYVNHRDHKALCKPIPSEWLDLCELSTNSLFPPNYVHAFYSLLPGIGLKMRHLCAEAIHNTIVGPAIDCHCIRFGVEFGTIHASMNVEQISSFLIKIYNNSQLPGLNEIPATIAQYLTSPVSPHKDSFVTQILSVANKYDLEDNMKGFLFHYYRTGDWLNEDPGHVPPSSLVTS